MPRHLESINFDALKIYDDWTSAPTGSVVQFRKPGAKGNPLVGLRCVGETTTAHVNFVLVVIGDAADGIGTLLGVDDLPLVGALDVSKQFRFCIADPAPFPILPHSSPQRGDVCRETSGFFVVYATTTRNEIPFWIHIHDPSGKKSVGSSYDKPTKENPIRLGAIVVRHRDGIEHLASLLSEPAIARPTGNMGFGRSG